MSECIIDRILEHGFLTGSQAFETSTKESDYDIVVPMTKLAQVGEIIKDYKITESNYFSGFYIDDNGKEINIIPVHPDEYNGWFFATEAMKNILKYTKVDRKTKYALFGGVRALATAGNLQFIKKGDF